MSSVDLEKEQAARFWVEYKEGLRNRKSRISLCLSACEGVEDKDLTPGILKAILED